jgi:hypothetical protein
MQGGVQRYMQPTHSRHYSDRFLLDMSRSDYRGWHSSCADRLRASCVMYTVRLRPAGKGELSWLTSHTARRTWMV